MSYTDAASFQPSFDDLELDDLWPAPRRRRFNINERYDMSSEKNGYVVIFNQEKFDPSLGLTKRDGAHHDVMALCETFDNRGFEVLVRHNYTYRQILNQYNALKNLDQTKYNSLFIIMMTHGIYDEQTKTEKIFAEDRLFSKSQLWVLLAEKEIFCGKPKLIFVQACRGNVFDKGTLVYEKMSVGEDNMNEPMRKYTLPKMSDILIAHSAYDGYVSWRNALLGSWFIMTLANELNRNIFKYDMLELLTNINRSIAYGYESNGLRNLMKQMPVFESMLTGQLEFTDETERYSLRAPIGIALPKGLMTEYDMKHKHRGKAVFFNQLNFDGHPEKSRTCVNDISKLKRTFSKYGFEIDDDNVDLTYSEIMLKLEAVSQADHSENDCLAVIFSSHGNETQLYAKDREFETAEIFKLFHADVAESLAGKPKMFFINACRGRNFDEGVCSDFSELIPCDNNMYQSDEVDLPSTSQKQNTSRKVLLIPNTADILIMYSSAYGFTSYSQNCQTGHQEESIFLNILNDVLLENHTTNQKQSILNLLTRITYKMAICYETKDDFGGDRDAKKVTPVIKSSLTKKLILAAKTQ